MKYQPLGTSPEGTVRPLFWIVVLYELCEAKDVPSLLVAMWSRPLHPRPCGLGLFILGHAVSASSSSAMRSRPLHPRPCGLGLFILLWSCCGWYLMSSLADRTRLHGSTEQLGPQQRVLHPRLPELEGEAGRGYVLLLLLLLLLLVLLSSPAGCSGAGEELVSQGAPEVRHRNAKPCMGPRPPRGPGWRVFIILVQLRSSRC